MKKTVKKQDSLTCYFHFMFNAWNEEQAKRVFANAMCGWRHIWQKWCMFCEKYGLNGAITMFYVEGLDSNLRLTLAEAANEYYNG